MLALLVASADGFARPGPTLNGPLMLASLSKPVTRVRLCEEDANVELQIRMPAVEEASLQDRLAAMQQTNETRGKAALLIILLIVAWLFSVPPAIRRTDVCGPQATENSNCVSVSTLWKSVAEHYSTCGRTPDASPCVAWDFSVDPKSQAAFSEAVRALQSDVPAFNGRASIE